MKNKFLYLLAFIIALIFSAGCCVYGTTIAHKEIVNLQQKNIVKHLQRSTIVLGNEGGDDFVCSGVWVTKYHFITARHCIENDDGSVSPGSFRKFYTYESFNPDLFSKEKEKEEFFNSLPTAIVIGYEEEKDIAILSTMDELDHDIASIYMGEIFDGMTPIRLMGHPAMVDFSYTEGVVSKTRIMSSFGLIQKTIQITTLVYGGSSGGGAFNEGGELIGITLFSKTRVPGMFFFLHRDEIVKFLKDNQIEFS